MNQIDTIDIDIDTIEVVTFDETIKDNLFEETSFLYFKLRDDVFISAQSIHTMHLSSNFTFTPSEWVTFPVNYNTKGNCIICDCYTNVGFRLLNVDSVLCNACFNRVFTEAMEWIIENPDYSVVDTL